VASYFQKLNCLNPQSVLQQAKIKNMQELMLNEKMEISENFEELRKNYDELKVNYP
jgi:hypothetical protein